MTLTTIEPSGSLDSKRRFTYAVLSGAVVVAAGYLWVLFDLWNDWPSLFRTSQSTGYAANFYDLQARAMLHGHLYIANGALGGLGRSDHHRPWNMAGRALDSHGSVQEIDVPEFEAEEFTTM
jgi:hypothetical protein